MRLLGGAEEPEYLPVDQQCSYHRLFYRQDYFASALHETAHWCIAGESRRGQRDFGYWYQSGDRSRREQLEFEEAEMKPQGLELLFSLATGYTFKASADNFATDNQLSSRFLSGIYERSAWYLDGHLSARMNLFINALFVEFETFDDMNAFTEKANSAVQALLSVYQKDGFIMASEAVVL